jgi:YD repeat-containing protein
MLNLPALNQDYAYSDNGQLVRISSPLQQHHYQYDAAGRLSRVHLIPADTTEDFMTDPAGNRWLPGNNIRHCPCCGG